MCSKRRNNESWVRFSVRAGLVPKCPREMATEHDEAGGQHDDEQRGVSRYACAVEHGRLAERRTGSQHPRGQQQHAVDLDGGAPRSSSPTFRRFLSGLVLRSLLTTAWDGGRQLQQPFQPSWMKDRRVFLLESIFAAFNFRGKTCSSGIDSIFISISARDFRRWSLTNGRTTFWFHKDAQKDAFLLAFHAIPPLNSGRIEFWAMRFIAEPLTNFLVSNKSQCFPVGRLRFICILKILICLAIPIKLVC